MNKPPISSADERALKMKKEDKRFLKNKKDATKERVKKINKLRALRLEQEKSAKAEAK